MLTKIRNKLKLDLFSYIFLLINRPALIVVLLMISVLVFFNYIGVIKQPAEKYQDNGKKILLTSQIHDNDVICISGTVAKITYFQGFAGDRECIEITNVYIRNKAEAYKKTEYYDNNSSKNRIMTRLVKDNNTTNDIKVTKAFQRIQVYLEEQPDIKLGSMVEVKGKLSTYKHATNPGQFDACDFYGNRGYIFAVKDAKVIGKTDKYNKFLQLLHEIKLDIENKLEKSLGYEDAAIIKAMILGIKGDIDEQIKDSFQKNGISHILAISGLHISFFCMGVYTLLLFFGISRWLCSLLSELFLILYLAMIGVSGSALRAGIMFSLLIISKLCKRSYDLVTAMSIAAVLHLMINPFILWDTAFQLTYMAVTGVALYKYYQNNSMRYETEKPYLSTDFTMIPKPVFKCLIKIKQSFFFSIFIYICTLPILVNTYYDTAFYSVVLNLIVIPLMSTLLIASVILIIMTYLVNGLSFIPVALVKGILMIYKMSCSYLEATGFGRKNVGTTITIVIFAYYLAFLLATTYKRRFRDVFLVLVCILDIFLLCSHTRWNISIFMLDVGQGDGIVLINDNFNAYIFDGGSSSNSNIGEKCIIPMLKSKGINEIEGIFISHPDSDHMNGIDELITKAVNECVNIKNIYVYEGFAQCDEYVKIFSNVDTSKTNIFYIYSGYSINDDDLNIKCIYPNKECEIANTNNASLVFYIQYKDFSMLETGDVEASGEIICLDRINEGRVDVLKVSHHGSNTASSEEMLYKCKPKIALISAGEGNSYGHPHQDVLNRLKEAGTDVFCTIECGAIEIITNGKNIRLKKYK